MKLKTNREILFVAAGVVLLFLAAGFIVYSINFLVKNTRDALGEDSVQTKEIVKFNMEGLKELGITK